MPTTARLRLDVTFDPAITDTESVATALDRLLETALSTPGIMDEYGTPTFGPFLVLHDGRSLPKLRPAGEEPPGT